MSIRKSLILLFAPILLLGCNAESYQMPVAAGGASKPVIEKVIQPDDPIFRWRINTQVNDLDGTSRVSMGTRDVVVRCSPKVEGYIIPTLTNLGHMLDVDSNHTQVVRYKIDNGPVTRERWEVSDSFDTLFMPRNTLRRVARGHALTVEFKPEYVIPETETFDLSGLAQALQKANCNI